MANILLTEKCNLKCSYCFAKDYTNQHSKEISFENFKKAVAFISKGNPNAKIGLIGGEPTLYSHFGEVLDYLENTLLVNHAVIFTNGILLEKYKEHIVSDKLVFLINCNSPDDIGTGNYEKMVRSIRCLIEEKELRNNIMLGLNIYKKNMDITYFCDLLEQFHFKYARISVVVPPDMENYSGAFDYFQQMKPTLLAIFQRLAGIGVLPKYDCNRIPRCLWTDSEQNLIKELFGKRLQLSNILHDTVICKPTLDIDTELKVIRCFGFSDELKADLEKFESIDSLNEFFVQEIDHQYINSGNKCKNSSRDNGKHCADCYGGCLAFKKKRELEW